MQETQQNFFFCHLIPIRSSKSYLQWFLDTKGAEKSQNHKEEANFRSSSGATYLKTILVSNWPDDKCHTASPSRRTLKLNLTSLCLLGNQMLEFLGTSKHHFLGPFFFFFASSDCGGVCTRFHESEITWEFSLDSSSSNR